MAATGERLIPTFSGPLDEQDLARFEEEGYLAFEGVLPPETVKRGQDALSELARGLIEDAKQGRANVVAANPNATQNYAGVRIQEPDGPLGIHFEAGVDPIEMDTDTALERFRKLHGYDQSHPVFQSFVTHPSILGPIESLMGEAARLKAVMALSKPAYIGSEKPWHQDNAYFDWLPLDKIITAWIALDDVTVENGCMFVLPGRHRIGALKHVHTIDCQIVEGRLNTSNAVPVEMRAGGAMFFSGMLPHQTPPNRTSRGRRALQFQYRGISTRQVSKEEYGRAFVEADGTPATCAFGERMPG